MCGGIGQERHEARVLERNTQAALVLGAGARLASWLNFTKVGKLPAQSTDILVVNLAHMVDAERADLTAGPESTAAAEGAALPAVRALAAIWSVTPLATRAVADRTGGGVMGGGRAAKVSSLHR